MTKYVCTVSVMVSSALGLLTIVLLARLAAMRKDERAHRAGLLDDDQPTGQTETAQADDLHDDTDLYGTDHDAMPERLRRAFVTVDELIERVEAEKASHREATLRTAPLPRVQTPRRPSPHPRSARR